MGFDWTHGGPTVLAAFLASLVEFVEALTVVLAVGAVRGWRDTLSGTAIALLSLACLTALLGPALSGIPLGPLRLGLGVVILLFGLRWLRKAILRAAGVIPLRDEAAAYARQTAALRAAGEGPTGRLDRIAFNTAFSITMVEGIEVVFVVIGLSAGGDGLLGPASLGAAGALFAVAAFGLLLHRPMSMIPENTLKLVVGVLLCAFGTFWVGEGMGLVWPAGDWSVPSLVACFLLVAALTVLVLRRRLSLSRGSERHTAESCPTSE